MSTQTTFEVRFTHFGHRWDYSSGKAVEVPHESQATERIVYALPGIITTDADLEAVRAKFERDNPGRIDSIAKLGPKVMRAKDAINGDHNTSREVVEAVYVPESGGKWRKEAKNG